MMSKKEAIKLLDALMVAYATDFTSDATIKAAREIIDRHDGILSSLADMKEFVEGIN